MMLMKALVVYYSRTGNTRKVAEQIAMTLGSDIVEIIDLKNRKGIFGFLTAGYSAYSRKLTEIKAPDADPSAYDLLVVGTPIWAGNITPAIRTYLTRIASGGAAKTEYAFFYTSSASGEQKKAYSDFCKLVNKEPLAALSVSRKDLETDNFKLKVQDFAKALSTLKAGS